MAQSPVDHSTLQDLVASTDMAFVQELIEAFLEDGREQIAAMRQSLASGDVLAFQRAAHSLKSSSASLGALGFSAQAKELEQLAKAGQPGGSSGRAGAGRGRVPRHRTIPAGVWAWSVAIRPRPAACWWWTTTR